MLGNRQEWRNMELGLEMSVSAPSLSSSRFDSCALFLFLCRQVLPRVLNSDEFISGTLRPRERLVG